MRIRPRRSLPAACLRVGVSRVVMVALCVTAVACTGSSGTPDPTPGVEVENPETSLPGSVAGTAGPPPPPETLAGFLGPAFDAHDPAAAHAHYLARERAIQEEIAACMEAAGFDYVPVEPAAGEGAFDPDALEDRIRTHGFGVTTWYDDDGTSRIETPASDDPNADIVAGLDEAGLTAYRTALYGSGDELEHRPGVDPDAGEGGEIVTGFGDGCEGRAYDAEYGVRSAVFEELEPELVALDGRIEADERIVALRQEWSACMAAAGFEFEARSDLLEAGVADLQGQLEELVGSQPAPDDSPSLSEDEAARLATLQATEIALAVADLECSGDHDQTYAEVSAEYEDEFIEANRGLLERLRSGD